MFDWIGSIQIRAHSPKRVILSLARATHVFGGIAALSGVFLAWWLSHMESWIVLAPVVFAGFGFLLAVWRREFDFDVDAGVLRYQHTLLGLGRTQVIPLFHIRAIVVALRATGEQPGLRRLAVGDYVAYIERRVGEPIYLDESRRCAHLLTMAEAISEVAELRLEYDAMSQA